MYHQIYHGNSGDVTQHQLSTVAYATHLGVSHGVSTSPLVEGRLMALFRHGRCQERVRHFGASAYGAAAVAQNSGPECI